MRCRLALSTQDWTHLSMVETAPPNNPPTAAPTGLPRPKHVKTTVRAGSCKIVLPTIPKPAGTARDRPRAANARVKHMTKRFYASDPCSSCNADSRPDQPLPRTHPQHSGHYREYGIYGETSQIQCAPADDICQSPGEQKTARCQHCHRLVDLSRLIERTSRRRGCVTRRSKRERPLPCH